LCCSNASHIVAHQFFSFYVRRNGCFLLTGMGETRNSGFGVRASDSQRVNALHTTTEGRSIDRSLVQMKHSRSSIDVGCGIAEATKTAAQQATCARSARRASGRAALASVEGKVPRRIAGPMKLTCPRSANSAAGLVRNRLHGRPLVNRATDTNDTRRSPYR